VVTILNLLPDALATRLRVLVYVHAEVTNMCVGCGGLVCAGVAGHVKVTELLLESGSDIQAGDSLGFVAVQYACYTGRLNILELLLKVGATTRPRGSQACEDLARRQGYVDLADWVLRYETRIKRKKSRKPKRQKQKREL
jgi:ankyrin repeat protein